MADYRIWPATNGPNSSSDDGQPVNLATEFYVTQTCWVKGILIWRGDTNVVGPVLGRIWQVDSSTTGLIVAGTDVTFTLSGTGWQTALLQTPVQLTANQRYRTSAHYPGIYSGTAGYWNPGGPGENGFTNGPLVAPSNGPGASQSSEQGAYDYSSSFTYPTNNFQGGGYWIDVLVTDIDPAVIKQAAFMNLFEN